MKKEKSTKIIAIFTVICAFIALINAFFGSLLLPLYLSFKFNIDTRNAGSIGVIGGADGPTAIYVSGSSSHVLTAIFALLTILGIIYLVIAKHKKIHN